MAIQIKHTRSVWKYSGNLSDPPEQTDLAIAEVECTDDDIQQNPILFITALWSPQQEKMLVYQGSEVSFFEFFQKSDPEETEAKELNKHVKWYTGSYEAAQSPLFVHYRSEFELLKGLIVKLLQDRGLDYSEADFF